MVWFIDHHHSFITWAFQSLPPLDGCFPACCENLAPGFRMEFSLGWHVSFLKDSVPLSGQPEVLVNLSWRCSPG